MLAYLGPSGTYSEQAAGEFCRTVGKKRLLPCPTIFDVIMAVQNSTAEYGITPIENSIEGSISTTLDMLAKKDIKLFIIREIDIKIINNLIVLPGVRAKDIKTIFSHPQPLAQCQEYIRKKFPEAKTFPANSTADAVRRIKNDNLVNHAAVGSAYLAKIENMKILARNINDAKDNVTRFVVFSKKNIAENKNSKTSIVFSCMKDRPGSLYEILGFLAKTKINMTKIESRPNKSMLGEYLFFIDIEGSIKDAVVKGVLDMIKKHSSYYKYLGSYKRSLSVC